MRNPREKNLPFSSINCQSFVKIHFEMKCNEGVLYDGWVAMLYIEHAAWLMKVLHILSIGQTGKLSRQEADPPALNNLFIFP